MTSEYSVMDIPRSAVSIPSSCLFNEHKDTFRMLSTIPNQPSFLSDASLRPRLGPSGSI